MTFLIVPILHAETRKESCRFIKNDQAHETSRKLPPLTLPYEYSVTGSGPVGSPRMIPLSG
ncbi:uncharacterized protein PHALS_06632 [Plasmopara halstedii]|uniref:Uncharacterized protein n=1 Tax=Plasmopara halstedii TaxID=4781 RepID=A0A0P1B3I5_PLAHL|nr:uncharacterized protein PHALS_06632 [Plasmopara halstedii]CEG48832.1 hypothetical protein PHALS_06632 [Plasmopara halstedii]|eukprot:XP_024585201.1 hypothetical protein PHALS_06632 [Plasmopara halstedii]